MKKLNKKIFPLNKLTILKIKIFKKIYLKKIMKLKNKLIILL